MTRKLRHGLARRKRRLTTATLALAALALALAAGVWAGGGAGFTRVTTSTSISTSGSGASTLATGADTATTTSGITLTATLDIDFKDVFGAANVATITASVDHASFFWECFNNGGNHPKSANKGIIEVPGSVVSQQFPVDKNGNVTGVLDLSSSVENASFCPSGQETHVYAVFVDVNLKDDASPPHTYHLDSVTTDTIIY
jgi:hypothetical protein